jgi:5-methyltetrahydrofolate--homocysteine methyltransferase
MPQSIQRLNEQNEFPLLVMPNAGMPSNEGWKAIYAMTPNGMCGKLQAFVENYKTLRIIGGCCGTNPRHIKAMRNMLNDLQTIH